MKNGYCRTIGFKKGIGNARAQYVHLVCKNCGELKLMKLGLVGA